jgi:hypothetical protein
MLTIVNVKKNGTPTQANILLSIFKNIIVKPIKLTIRIIYFIVNFLIQTNL